MTKLAVPLWTLLHKRGLQKTWIFDCRGVPWGARYCINDGHNKELLDKCRTLSEYMTFVNIVRRNKSNRMSINSAVTSAVDECIENNVLKDFFKEHREEVLGMGRMEFDEEAFKEAMYEDGYEDGEKAGLEKGMEKTAVSLLTTDMRLEDIAKHTGLTLERVRELAG